MDYRRFARSFQHALEGVLDVYRSQRHMRVHFVFMGINAILAMVYKLSALEVAILLVVIAMVVFAEMVNTVIEAIINMVSETYSPIARFAKDVAAGGVLVTAANACLVGVCIYLNPERLERLRRIWIHNDYVDNSATLRALAISFLLLLLVITAVKVGKPERSVLTGGPISGHTAFAFCLASSLYFMVQDTSWALLALLLAGGIALLVAHLRLHDGIHDARTVIYGAAVGTAIPLLVFQVLAHR
jgi:diacylglycerol kinase (ATP)